MRRYYIFNTICAIIYNYQFFVRIILLQKISNSIRYKCPPVIGRHYAGNKRRIELFHLNKVIAFKKTNQQLILYTDAEDFCQNITACRDAL
jgi:hypothetical protein